MMWLERYVNAVKMALPGGIREDVGDELYSLLEEEVEEAEEQQGAPLSEEMLLKMLRGRGHPLAVAAGYGEHRTLIGEALYPFYKAALLWLALVVFVLYLCRILLDSLLADSWVAHHFFSELVVIYLLVFALVTLAFHLVDRFLTGIDWYSEWNPRRLPPIVGAIPRVGPVVALACITAWLVFLGSIEFERTLALMVGREGARIHTFVMWLQVHGLLTFILYGWLAFHPWWNAPKLAVRGAIALLLAGAALHSQQLDRVSDFLVLGDEYSGSSAVDRVLWAIVFAGCVEAGYCVAKVSRGRDVA